MATGPRPGSGYRTYHAPGPWAARAACKGTAPSHDEPLPGETAAQTEARVEDALAVCRGCSVRAACHRWTMEQKRSTRRGVMGGTFWPTIHPSATSRRKLATDDAA